MPMPVSGVFTRATVLVLYIGPVEIPVFTTHSTMVVFITTLKLPSIWNIFFWVSVYSPASLPLKQFLFSLCTQHFRIVY